MLNNEKARERLRKEAHQAAEFCRALDCPVVEAAGHIQRGGIRLADAVVGVRMLHLIR